MMWRAPPRPFVPSHASSHVVADTDKNSVFVYPEASGVMLLAVRTRSCAGEKTIGAIKLGLRYALLSICEKVRWASCRQRAGEAAGRLRGAVRGLFFGQTNVVDGEFLTGLKAMSVSAPGGLPPHKGD